MFEKFELWAHNWFCELCPSCVSPDLLGNPTRRPVQLSLGLYVQPATNEQQGAKQLYEVW